MSHIVETKTSIANPNLTFLTQAVQIVAGRHQGEIRSAYIDYSKRSHPVSTGLAIFTPRLKRGIGIEIDKATGALKFIGDPFLVEGLYNQVQEDVIQTYVSIGYMAAAQQLGYLPQAIVGEGRQIIVEAVQYA